jgi:hypothetical protein
MMYPIFGSKNVKTAEELRNVGRRSKVKSASVDSWSLDEVDALRVPILSGPQLVYSSNAKTRWNAPSSRQIGIYSCSQTFCEKAASVISAHKMAFQCFGFAEQHQDINFQALHNIDIWLVNVLDDDESPLLDRIMNICSNVSSLFLFDPTLSQNSIKKLEAFIQESALAT